MAGNGRMGRNYIIPISVFLLSPSPTFPLCLWSFKFIFHMFLLWLFILISSQRIPYLSAHNGLSGGFLLSMVI